MFSLITGFRPTAFIAALVSIICLMAIEATGQELRAPYQSQLPAPMPGSGLPPAGQAAYGGLNQGQLQMLAQAVAAPVAAAPNTSAAPTLGVATPLEPAQDRAANLPPATNEVIHHVRSANDRLEMMVNSSKIVTLDQNIPRAQVNNKEIVELTALSPTEIQVFAKKAGVTQVNLWTEKGQIYTIDCVVLGDARELQELLRTQYPAANLVVRPLGSGVMLSGFVDRPDQVSQIIQIAQDYYPKVIPDIRVGGVQQILLHVKVAEVDRSKVRNLGFDFSEINGQSFVTSSISNMLAPGIGAAIPTATGDTARFGIVNNNNAFYGFLNALRKDDLLKIVADPTLVTVSGRPAQFKAGGEVPYAASASLGSVSVAWKDTGIIVDFVPIVLGNGNIRLEVRPVDRELDETQSFEIAPGFVAPGFTQRMVDTAVEMQPGQTLAIAGLVSTRVVAERREIPWLGELPYVGAAFRQNKQEKDEIELLFLVTPEIVAPLDCGEAPPCVPGEHSDEPTDCEMFWKGYIEVPSHGPCGPGGCGPIMPPGPSQNPNGGMTKSDVTMPRGYDSIPGGTPMVPTPAIASPTSPAYSPRSASNMNNQYNPPRPQEPRSASSASRAAAPPGVVGPTGYDVLN
jgi:pilus assembly protein CpaC